MLSCMDLYGLVETPGLIPGLCWVAGVGHDKGFQMFFGSKNPCHILVVGIVGTKFWWTFLENISGVPHYIDLHISHMWSCGVFPTVVWPGN